LHTERIHSFFTAKRKHRQLFTFTSELESGLTPATAFDWLLFSRCNVDDLASTCISHILMHLTTALPVGFIQTGLQAQHLEQLCSGLQAKNAAQEVSLASLRVQLSVAQSMQYDGPEPNHGHFCLNCRMQWYIQPNGVTPAPHCIKCGIPKQRGL
jgi:hypothetical protein